MIKRFELLFWAAALAWAAMAIWPASFWYRVGTVRIDDVRAGEPVEILYTGGPLRDFRGAYAVVMRDAVTGEIVGEDRSQVFQYRRDVDRPDPIKLAWWAPGLPEVIPAGAYILETCWTVYGAFWGLAPPKTTCTTSNIFRVTE